MQSIANLINNDPYLTMPREQRIAERKRRRAAFKLAPVVTPLAMAVRPAPLAAPMTDPPLKESAPEPTVIYRLWCDDLVHYGLSVLTRPTVWEIINATARYFGLLARDIMKGGRVADFVYARHVAMFLASRLTKNSLTEIARRFGGMDHTTVLHAVRKIEVKRSRDEKLNVAIAAIGLEFPFYSEAL